MSKYRDTDIVFDAGTALDDGAYSRWVNVADGVGASFQVYWTGTDEGTFTVQITNEPNPDPESDDDAHAIVDTFDSQPAGAAGKAYIEFNTGARRARIKYVRTTDNASPVTITKAHFVLKG